MRTRTAQIDLRGKVVAITGGARPFASGNSLVGAARHRTLYRRRFCRVGLRWQRSRLGVPRMRWRGSCADVFLVKDRRDLVARATTAVSA
jgi:hypothetical protein